MADAATMTAEAAATAEKTWNELLQAYSKNASALGATPFLGGAMPFPFPQPMFPFNPLALFGGMGGFNPAAFSLTTGNDEAKSGAAGSDIKQEPAASNEEEEYEAAEEEDKEEGPRTRKRAAARAASAPTNGKKARGEGLGVRSNSSAALAMLAGAAAGKTNGGGGGGGGATSSTPQAAPAAEVWQGQVPGSQMGSGSGSEPGQMTADQAALMGITDERELKRLRRKQSNRESARRSRLRKQAECEALARQVKDLSSENSKLKEEKLQLLAQIEILNAKLSMSAFGAVHALGQGDLEKIQAELRKQSEAQHASMAAALAQVGVTLAGGDGGAAAAAAAAAANGADDAATTNGKADEGSDGDD